MKHLFSERGNAYQGSPIDLKMKGSTDPSIKPIYLSIGEPNPANIPSDMLHQISNELFTQTPYYLRYGGSDGHQGLRDYLVNFHRKEAPFLTHDHILITSGSTQGMDAVCKLFINAGDVCLVESPTYSNIFSTMKNYGAEVIESPVDKDGLNPDLVEEQILQLTKMKKKLKLLCTIPHAQNPSGITLSEERRVRLYELARIYDFVIVEDDPYSGLTFSGEKKRPIFSLDEDSKHVIYLNSFSKIIAPGLRVGWLIAHPEIVKRLSLMKQSMDSCSAPLSQEIIYQFCQKGMLEPHMKKITRDYYLKKEEMMNTLNDVFHDRLDIQWTNPEGGMFVWFNAGDKIQTQELVRYGQQQGVAFVPGQAFSPSQMYENHIRLCFAFCEKEDIREGISRLRRAVDAMSAGVALKTVH